MQTTKLILKGALIGLLFSGPAVAQLDLGGLAKKAGDTATKAGKDEVEKKVNAKLLADARKNQCSFKTDTDQLAPGCDEKLK
jgi:OOP family OmpA-OmpF porin